MPTTKPEEQKILLRISSKIVERIYAFVKYGDWYLDLNLPIGEHRIKTPNTSVE
jgi:hypothetical protein